MDLDTILGIVLVVLGILALIGEVSFGFILPVLGIALIVLGILILGNVLSAGTITAVVLLVLGLLLYSGQVGVPSQIVQFINIIVGVVLLILGLRELT